MDVAEVGSYYVGGHNVTLADLPKRTIAGFECDPNGDLEVEAMYVQYVRLTKPRGRYPLMLWHGAGYTGSCYETKPDGGPGWQQYFLQQGWDVYLSDAVERGRAGFPSYPEIWKSAPHFRTKKEAWERFRIGAPGSYDTDPSKRKALPGSQFPVEAFDAFSKSAVARWDGTEPIAQKAYDEYVRLQGPCVIIAHSQSAAFACTTALRAPELVKAVVINEGRPGVATGSADLSPLKDVPHLFFYGDFIGDDFDWKTNRETSLAYVRRLVDAGVPADFYDLPQMGIRGNSHMCMLERNSDEIAAVIQKWLESKGLVR